MMAFDQYLDKGVTVICDDLSEFTGIVDSFGGSVQGKEEYDREEAFISIYTGDGDYVLFESEIKDIIEL